MVVICRAKRTVIIFSIFTFLLVCYHLFSIQQLIPSDYEDLSLTKLRDTHKLHHHNFNNFSNYEDKKNCLTIHVSVVCAGSESSQQLVTLIKSLLFHRRDPLHIHFLVNKKSKLVLRHLFQTWDIPDFTVSFYQVDRYLERIAWIPNNHYSGIYGLLKVLVLDILPPNIDKVIALDTDLVFLTDLRKLWDLFDKFTKEQAIGLVENQSDWYLGTLFRNYAPWPSLGRGFNTGVMLLNLGKLRKVHWSGIWSMVTKNTLSTIPSTALADQDIINAVLKEHPQLVYKLPCYWNLQMAEHMKPELCYHDHHSEIKAIHWNTKNKERRVDLTPLQNLYQIFSDLNGDLVRFLNLNCKSLSDDVHYTESEDDVDENTLCSQLKASGSRLRRTHLYFLPFEYDAVEKFDVSIVVQLSADRFAMLENICTHWEGPVSAAVFLSDVEAQKIINFVETSEVLSSRRNIAYHFVFKSTNENVYPINYLRNVALRFAFTEYVFLYDVDFVPMPGLYQYLVSHIASSGTFDKIAFIIPAFESLQYKFTMPLTKSELLKDLDSGTITTFRSYIWPLGHAATNFTAWILATKEYDILWEPKFEPYVVVKRKICPAYDKRFFGYGWNKISHIMELDAAGFTFRVLPFGFIVHLPHSPSIDLLNFRSLPTYRDCIESAKHSFIKYLSNKYGAAWKYKESYEE